MCLWLSRKPLTFEYHHLPKYLKFQINQRKSLIRQKDPLLKTVFTFSEVKQSFSMTNFQSIVY